MNEFKPGDLIRLISSPIEGVRDVGEVFEAFGTREMHGETVVQHLNRPGYVTHAPAAYFEPAGAIRAGDTVRLVRKVRQSDEELEADPEALVGDVFRVTRINCGSVCIAFADGIEIKGGGWSADRFQLVPTYTPLTHKERRMAPEKTSPSKPVQGRRIVPTWSGVAPLLIDALKSGYVGVEYAEAEIKGMAVVADMAAEAMKLRPALAGAVAFIYGRWGRQETAAITGLSEAEIRALVDGETR